MALHRRGRPDARRPDGGPGLCRSAAAGCQRADRFDGAADLSANSVAIAIAVTRPSGAVPNCDADTKPEASIALLARGTLGRAWRQFARPGRPQCVEPVATRPMTALNPLTWCVWGLTAVAAALTERNPYLQLLLLAILLTVWIAGRRDRSVGYWRAALALGLLPILFSLVFSRFGSHVLFRLPAHLPVIGGAWTLEAALYGASTGAALLLTILVFAIAQSTLRTADLLAVLPRPLYRLGNLIALALALVPQALASLQAVRRTARLPGR